MVLCRWIFPTFDSPWRLLQPKFFKGKYQDSLTLFNLPLQVATEREIARQQYTSLGRPLSDWSVRLKDFPHPALSTNNIVGQVIGPFLFAASMFSYVPVVSDAVQHAVLGLSSHRAQAVLMLVLMLCSCCAHPVLMLCSCCAHAVIMLCSRCAHAVQHALTSHLAHAVQDSSDVSMPAAHVICAHSVIVEKLGVRMHQALLCRLCISAGCCFNSWA